jgi:hypothetical protein
MIRFSAFVVYLGGGGWEYIEASNRHSILRVFENKVLRIFGLKGDEVMGGGALCSSPSIIRMIKWRRVR